MSKKIPLVPSLSPGYHKELEFDSRTIRRILVILFQMAGEALSSTAFIHSLVMNFPSAHITYLTGAFGKGVLLNNPDINELLVYHSGVYAAISRQKAYDLVVDFDESPESQMLSVLSRGRYRIGTRKANFLGSGKFRAYTMLPKRPHKHRDVIEYFLYIGKWLGLKKNTRRTKIYLMNKEKRFAVDFFKAHGLEEGNIIGIQPGGHRVEELWSAKKFSQLADKLITRYRCTVCIFQGPGEEVIAQWVYRNIRQKKSAFLVPVVEMRKYFSLLCTCRVFIAHDRGPMHFAACFNVRTVAIFTAPVASYWFPYKEKKCMAYLQRNSAREITVNEVLEAVDSVYH